MPRPRRQPRFRDQERFRKGVSIIPSLFTIGNIFCGYYAIIQTLKGNHDYAAMAIGIGYLLDGLDGRIARLTRTTSDFGLELDSLADVLTFGIAPATLAFSWGMASISGIPADIARHVHQAGWLTTFAFVICGTLRLARFNIQAKKVIESSSKRFFVGLPIPAGAGMIAAVVHYQKAPILQVGSAMLWCLLIALVSFLMISTVRYHSFKDLDLGQRRPSVVVVFAALIIAVVVSYSEVTLLAMASAYVSSGPVAKLLSVIRRARVAEITPPEPVHGSLKG